MNKHYMGFINTCVGFGMSKEAADTLYKRASKFRAVRGAISAIRKAMEAGKGLNTVMYNGKALAENGRKMNQLRTFLGRARNSKYFANPEEAAKMREFLGFTTPAKSMAGAASKASTLPVPAAPKVPMLPAPATAAAPRAPMLPAVRQPVAAPPAGVRPMPPAAQGQLMPKVNGVSPSPLAETGVARPPVNPAGGGNYIDVESRFVNPSQQRALARREAIKARFSARRGAPGGTPSGDRGLAARQQGIKERFNARRQAAQTGGTPPDAGVQPQVPDAAVNQMAAGATPAAGGNFFAAHPFLTTMGIAAPSYIAGRMMANRS